MLYQIYAFLTAKGWQEHAQDIWPDAVDVANYKLVVFTNKDEDYFTVLAESKGFNVKRLTGDDLLDAISAGETGPFICDYKSAGLVAAAFPDGAQQPEE